MASKPTTPGADRNRANTVDAEGRSWYVYDADRERLVAGPFGSKEYAETVRERSQWPWPDCLRVGNREAVA